MAYTADLIVEPGCIIGVPRQIEDEVLCSVSGVQEGSDLIDAVGVRGVFVGKGHGWRAEWERSLS